MAKAKVFNISSFVDDAAEGVRTAEQQKRKEELKKARALLEAENQAHVSQTVSPAPENSLPTTPQAGIQPAPQAQSVPQAEFAPQAQPIPQTQFVPQPALNPQSQYFPQAAQPITQPDQSKSKRGRKKSLRTIERINGKIVFLEKETDANLSRISTLERFDKQDIIRTALHQWLERHYDGMMLTGEGRTQVIEYIQRTTTFEEF